MFYRLNDSEQVLDFLLIKLKCFLKTNFCVLFRRNHEAFGKINPKNISSKDFISKQKWSRVITITKNLLWTNLKGPYVSKSLWGDGISGHLPPCSTCVCLSWCFSYERLDGRRFLFHGKTVVIQTEIRGKYLGYRGKTVVGKADKLIGTFSNAAIAAIPNTFFIFLDETP